MVKMDTEGIDKEPRGCAMPGCCSALDELIKLRNDARLLHRTNKDLVDTVEAILIAAGWNGTIEHLNSHGKKPSDFVRTRFDRLRLRTARREASHSVLLSYAVAAAKRNPQEQPHLQDAVKRADDAASNLRIDDLVTPILSSDTKDGEE